MIIILLLLTLLLVACNPLNNTSEPNKDVSLSEPPELTITIDNQSITALLGTYSWYIHNKDGTIEGMEADAFAPPELVKHQNETLTVEPKSSIVLNFENKPDAYRVDIWEGNNQITQQVNDKIVIAPEQNGLVVYEVYARWKEGTAFYAFAINVN